MFCEGVNIFVFKALKKCYITFFNVTIKDICRLFSISKNKSIKLKSFIMRKSVVVIALALGFSICNLNASNEMLTSEANEVIEKTVEVSPLCKAVAFGNLEEVNKLIKAGADVNAKSNGMMPIHYAAKYNRVEIIKALITAGSEIHKPCDQGYTALRHAKKSKAVDAEQFLMRFKRKTV